MSDRTQLYGWTAMTPPEGYAEFVQLFGKEDTGRIEVVMRRNDGTTHALDFSGCDIPFVCEQLTVWKKNWEARNGR